MSKASDFLREGAKTFDERNAVYGDNYLNVGGAFASLFPSGVEIKTADEWNRFHLLMLVIVKLSRYCNNFKKGGHQDSIHDAMVYCAMVEGVDNMVNQKTEPAFKLSESVLLIEAGHAPGIIVNIDDRGPVRLYKVASATEPNKDLGWYQDHQLGGI